MSVPYSPERGGDLCGVRGCTSLQEAVASVSITNGRYEETVELALCSLHLAELHEPDDPIELARTWLS